MSKQAKIVEFERFVNDKLRNDLKLVLDEQDKIHAEIADYLQIKDTIDKVSECKVSRDSKTRFKLNTRVDLGCNFYANAVVEDPETVCVAIGYGFFVEMKFDEALKFIDKKVKLLNELADELNVKACDIKANIKFVLEGIREMQEIQFNADKEEKHSLFV